MDTTIRIETRCPICGEKSYVDLTYDEYLKYLKWQRRELLIQEALPNLSAEDREKLITGICQKCWLQFVGDDED